MPLFSLYNFCLSFSKFDWILPYFRRDDGVPSRQKRAFSTSLSSISIKLKVIKATRDICTVYGEVAILFIYFLMFTKCKAEDSHKVDGYYCVVLYECKKGQKERQYGRKKAERTTQNNNSDFMEWQFATILEFDEWVKIFAFKNVCPSVKKNIRLIHACSIFFFSLNV